MSDTVAGGVTELLTADEVAHLLKIHRKTPYAWAREGRLPVVRLGPGSVRFRREDVEAFVADNLDAGQRS